MRRLERIELELRPILETIAEAYGVSWAEIKARDSHAAVAQARHACCYVMSRRKLLSMADIGKMLGGKHHTTVLHGIRKTAYRRETDPDLDALLRGIETNGKKSVIGRAKSALRNLLN